MTLILYGHPFSSYTWKVLIPLYADGTEFEYRQVPENEENYAELKRIWPLGKFPVLIDDGEPVIETTSIIEHLQVHHRGPNEWIPEGELGRRVRFLDRVFDFYIMDRMGKITADPLRPEGSRDSYGVQKAREELNIAYDWLERQLGQTWAVGDSFTLADCAAAPSLFYADWVEEIGPERPKLTAYRSRLLQHPIVARVVDEARPYRQYFPLGAPDRD